MSGRVAGAVANVEAELADRHRIAILKPAIGLERLAIDPVTLAVFLQPADPENIVLVRALDGHAQLGSKYPGRSAMVDVTMGQEDLLDGRSRLRGGRLQPVE